MIVEETAKKWARSCQSTVRASTRRTIRFVHQRRRIRAERRPLLPDVLPPEPAQVVVDERRQALERRLVAAPPRFEQRRDVGDGMTA